MKIREPFNAISHFAGAAAALIGLCVLLFLGGDTNLQQAALLIYGLSLVGMFTASGVYHSAIAKASTIEVFRKIDHSAIFLLIAGSYTPFCLLVFSGFWRWGMLAIVWSLAFIGIGVKLFIINTPRWVTAGVYLVMGWISVFAAREMILHLPLLSLIFLLAGGVFYTVGAVVYITKKGNPFPGVFGFHEIWHIFVLLGAAAHFAAITFII